MDGRTTPLARHVKAHDKHQCEVMANVIAAVRRQLRDEHAAAIAELRKGFARRAAAQRADNVTPMRAVR